MSVSRIALALAISLAASASGAPAALAARHPHAPPGDDCMRTTPAAPGHVLAQSAPGETRLGGGALTIPLVAVCTDDGKDLSLAQRVMGAAPRRRFLLVIEDIRAEAQPGVLFDLRLGVGEGGKGDGPPPGKLFGTLNFYAAQKPGVAARPRTVSYDVGRALRAIGAGGRLDRGLVLTLAPQHPPAPGSGATVGRIVLLEQ